MGPAVSFLREVTGRTPALARQAAVDEMSAAQGEQEGKAGVAGMFAQDMVAMAIADAGGREREPPEGLHPRVGN